MKRWLKYILCACIMVLLQISGMTYAGQVQEVPMLTGVRQTAMNQIEITYDKKADMTKATTPSNYWVQSTQEVNPAGIATLGKDQKIGSENALTADKVMIKAADRSGKKFALTFKENIKPGSEYKLIICYVTVPGGAPYTGDNGSAVFTGK